MQLHEIDKLRKRLSNKGASGLVNPYCECDIDDLCSYCDRPSKKCIPATYFKGGLAPITEIPDEKVDS